ncbi:polysaccharide biosynthesis protein GumN [Stenotrophomonas panacihumi]|uniref:Polysaccharide biosynthesis protein GumN n=1 Tax=Stenotrophomonas panacihumi TaxID=676599 RepID=A0A0R0AMB6_9GAMM|nr:polysaccharide biosynthesis protein GumN [Stenotrophomonas panacihumi]PTN55100.1 TraB/GumN family protein [Stenotrophomonas panacihumi]
MLALALAAPVAMAQETPDVPVPAPAAGQGGIVDLDAMVVRGVQPGPGLWKVTQGEHTLWILGTIAPLPDKMTWQADEVEEAIAQSQQILAAPSVMLDADVGFFGKLALVPSAMKAMKNPDGATLQDVLPADLYARWVPLKAYYLGRDGGIEKKRPMIAASELYQAAIKKNGLSRKPVVWPVVEAAAKRHGIKPTRTTLEFKVSDPKQALREFTAGGMDDSACFRSLLNAVQNDLPTMVERANAWAVGDIERLRNMPREDPTAACSAALSQTQFARSRGMDRLEERLREHWVGIVRKSLRENTGTFAVMPLSALLAPNGYLDALRAEGYEITAPE